MTFVITPDLMKLGARLLVLSTRSPTLNRGISTPSACGSKAREVACYSERRCWIVRSDSKLDSRQIRHTSSFNHDRKITFPCDNERRLWKASVSVDRGSSPIDAKFYTFVVLAVVSACSGGIIPACPVGHNEGTVMKAYKVSCN
jgi:hypothetical protein